MVGLAAGVAVVALLVVWVVWVFASKARLDRQLGELGGKRGLGGKRDFAFFLYLGGHRQLKSLGPAPLLVHLAENGLLLQLGGRRASVSLEEIVEASIETSVPSGARAEDLTGDQVACKLLAENPHLHLEIAGRQAGSSVMWLLITDDEARLCAEAVVSEVRQRRGRPEPVVKEGGPASSPP